MVEIDIVKRSDTGIVDIFSKMMRTATAKDFDMRGFKTPEIPEAEFQNFTGYPFKSRDPVKFNIFTRDKKLMAQATGQGAVPLEAVTGTRFTSGTAGIEIDFDPEKTRLDITPGKKKNTFNKNQTS